jgi:hypothetical protein
MGDMPTISGNDCYPPSTAPHPDSNFFCVGASSSTDYVAIAQSIKREMPHIAPGKPLKYAVIEEDIPGCVSDMNNYILPDMAAIGAKLVDKSVIPTSTIDMTASARAALADNADVIIHYCASSNAISLAKELKVYGFKGMFVTGGPLPGVVAEMPSLKTPTLYAVDWWSLPNGDPVWAKMRAAIKLGNSKFAITDLRFGWADAIVMAAALTKCGYPCSHSKLNTVMNHLTVSSKDLVDLMGNPSVWTPRNHTGPVKTYFLHSWDAKTGTVTNALSPFTVTQTPDK